MAFKSKGAFHAVHITGKVWIVDATKNIISLHYYLSYDHLKHYFISF